MSGIYIHIPFCRQACNYCNFYFSTSTNQKDLFFKSLLKEITLHNNWPFRDINTIYFGGGTPSIFKPEELRGIVKVLEDNFNVVPDAEITLEANPDDLDKPYLEALRSIGINRLSIGIQSFLDKDLNLMNRAHSATQAKECIENAHSVGFKNMSIDLIYGVPGLTSDDWQTNLETALMPGIKHLSAYCLTVEKSTALFHQIRKGKIKAVDEEAGAEHFEILMDFADSNGLEHYEISNFCFPSYRSKHNSMYWENKPYLGLGPSAHSYDLESRYWNIPNIKKYTDAISGSLIPRQKERITQTMRFNEYILTRIRLSEGINLNYINETFGTNSTAELKTKAQSLDKELIEINDHFIRLSRKGKLLADHLTVALLEDEE